MKLNRMGNSGLLIGDLSLGTMTFGDKTSAKEAASMVDMFIEKRRKSFWDTANGLCEWYFRRYLRKDHC